MNPSVTPRDEICLCARAITIQTQCNKRDDDKENHCIRLRPRCTTFSKYSVSGRGRDSVVGIASDTLQAAESGDRIPVGKRFSAHVQTGPGTKTASYTIGSGVFLGVERPGRGVDHAHHLSPRLKKE